MIVGKDVFPLYVKQCTAANGEPYALLKVQRGAIPQTGDDELAYAPGLAYERATVLALLKKAVK